jgi:hypothetical protein
MESAMELEELYRLERRKNWRTAFRTVLGLAVFFGILWLGDEVVISGSDKLLDSLPGDRDANYDRIASAVATLDDQIAVLSGSGLVMHRYMTLAMAIALVSLLAIYWAWKDKK